MKKLVLLFVILLTISSCRGKKRLVDKQETETSLEKVLNTDIEIDSSVTTEEKISAVSVVKETNETVINEIEADNTGVVTVEVKKTDTGSITTFTGVKKLKLSSDKKELNTVDSTLTTTNTSEKNNTKISNESLIDFKQKTKDKEMSLNIKSSSSVFWIIIGIVAIICLFLYIYFVGFRKKSKQEDNFNM